MTGPACKWINIFEPWQALGLWQCFAHETLKSAEKTSRSFARGGIRTLYRVRVYSRGLA